MAERYDEGSVRAVSASHSHGLIREGLATGMVGGVAVALWFLIVDTLGGRPLYTPALLGAVLTGADDAALAVDTGSRLGLAAFYSLFHFLAFGLVGILAVFLVHRAERTPSLIALLIMLFAAVEVAFTGFVALLEVNAIGSIAWYQVAIGNVVAAVVMGWYLVRSHPGMGGYFRRFATDDGS